MSTDLDRDATDALLVAAGHGDLGALAAFYDATAPVLFGLLASVLDDTAEAEDATVAVYRRIWRTAPLFDPAGRSAYALLLYTARREILRRFHHLRLLYDTTTTPHRPSADPPPLAHPPRSQAGTCLHRTDDRPA